MSHPLRSSVRAVLIASIATIFAAPQAFAQHDHPTPPDSTHRKPARDSSAGMHSMPPMRDMNDMTNMPARNDTAASSMSGMSMTSAPLGIPMQRMGSGTSWLPDATTMHAAHTTLGAWNLMLHGVAFAQYDDQGTPRGDRQFGSVNWGMLMASRDLAGGRFALHGMFSAEPFTIGSRGYPLLLQSGEAYHGQPLHDRQHPHDLFMELAAIYDHAVADNLAVSIYAAPVGEPAIGPVAFPHRPSAANNPLAPIGHHWQDATHISFGVITTGIYTRNVRVEASIFNGREPDETRTNFDYQGRSLDSYAGRITVNPDEHWSLSGSYAYLKSPEQLDPHESLRRISASILHEMRFGTSGDLASALIYGGNKHTGQTSLSNSVLAETNLNLDARNAVFARAEYVQKSPEDLAIAVELTPTSYIQSPLPNRYDVGEITLGYVRELASGSGGSLGLGAAGTLNMVPSTLRATYGTRTPAGAMIFLRLRPSAMRANAHMQMRKQE